MQIGNQQNTTAVDPLNLLRINELLDKQFYIPHYQRGYRWTSLQVEQLLDDIADFSPKDILGQNGVKTFYCLQPIVVKELNEEAKIKKELNGSWYEVIDGQQRLTTIYLIIQYINEFWTGKKKQQNFKIDFETRDGCLSFLGDICVNEDGETVNIDKENIDFFHISSAYQAIRNWEINYKDARGAELDDAGFKSNFLAYSKVIWYEVGQKEKSQALFERLNLGKIPLTNAELTKALFLSSNSFLDLSGEEQNIKQIEIARLWDEIEHKLNDIDLKFWSFITNKKRSSYETKIELILDMISGKSSSEKDPLFTFLNFSKKQKSNGLSTVWLEIEQFYYILLEWFTDKDLYHKIGFLITAKTFSKEKPTSIGELVKESTFLKKSAFTELVNDRIRGKVRFEISELRYKDHPSQIFNVLLLFNVETCRTSDAMSEFYPFKQHKDKLWSLEHIHARQSEYFDPTKKEPWLKWLELHLSILIELEKDSKNMFDSETLQSMVLDINTFNNAQLTWERFTALFKRVNDVFTVDSESMDRESEGLSNLALLSQPDNSALNNSVFEIKRREVIELDKKGSFIPVCTRRAFMKYYNDEGISNQHFFWSSTDRLAYFETIKHHLKPYLPTNHIDEDED